MAQQDIELRADAEKPAGTSRYWMLELESAEAAEKDYRETAQNLIKLYQGKGAGSFNIFWSNIETLKPVIYSQRPRPDIRQRKEIKDPLGREVAMVLERATRYVCDNKADYDFDEEVEAIRDEMLITGRGVPWLSYKPYIVETEESGEQLADQNIYLEYVHYQDYRQSPAKKWRDVRWVARKHTPSRAEGVKQFGKVFYDVPLSYSTLEKEQRDSKDGDSDVFKRAVVWEIWDKEKRQRVWVAEGHKTIIKQEDDPLMLEGFFPLPKPLYSFMIPGSLVPQAEYEIYKEQVAILNVSTDRINDLTRELKVKGLYSGVVTAIEQLANAKNGDLIPVNDLGAVGVKDMVAWWPLEQIAAALTQLYVTRDQAIQVIYQVTGISDIIRGSTQASETATAQQIKGNFAQLRLLPRQQPMQRMLRDVFRLKAEIIAEHFSPEILTQITGIQVTPEMVQVMRSDKLRSMTIDIESDSTVKADENADKQQRTEFLQALSGMLEQLIPMAQTGMVPPELAKALLSFGVRGFKVGRELEDALDALGEAPPPQPQPDPEAAKMQAEMQMRQAEMQMKQQEAQANFALKEKELQATMGLKQQEMQHSMQLEAMKAHSQAELEKYKADLSAKTAVETSTISAKTSLKTARIKGSGKQMDMFDNEGDDELIAEDETKQPTTTDLISTIVQGNQDMASTIANAIMQGMNQQTEVLVSTLTRPKQVVRDSAGRVAGVQ